MKLFPRFAALLICVIAFGGCAAYQASVGSRSVGLSGDFDKTTGAASGKVNYTVTYR